MSNCKEKMILITCLAMFLIVVVGGILIMQNHNERMLTLEQERQVAEAYLRVNIAFRIATDEMYILMPEMDPERDGEFNSFGINGSRFLQLRVFERETGNTLSHEMMVDYFSQEFEPDGSLRLYNNGNHPEIEAFVNWMWEVPQGQRWDDLHDYRFLLWRLHRDYSDANETFVYESFTLLSPQMLDALIRAEADPAYVIDLTSLQRAGY